MRHRRLASLVTCPLIVLVGAAIALAAAPVKGGSYSGTLNDRSDIAVTFKVSANGQTVRKLKVSDLPIFCEGGGQPIPVKFRKAAVSDKGRFKRKARTFFTNGDLQATVTIKGRFTKGRKARGSLAVDWNFSDDPDGCDGTSKWAATAP